MTEIIPAQGRIAGIDFGTVYVGVAITDAERILASPFQNYKRSGETEDSTWFQRFVTQEQVVGFVVGLPLHMSGDESEKSQQARQFGDWLEKVTDRPVTYHDERYTSVEAKRLLTNAQVKKKKRGERLDMLAAQIILASYLETGCEQSRPSGPLEDQDAADQDAAGI